MKLEPQEYDLLFKFINNANEFSVYDAKDRCVLQIRDLKKSAITFGSGMGNIMGFNLNGIHLDFPFEDYEIASRNIITFFKKDGYALSVLNYNDGFELIQELGNFKN